MSKIKTYTDEEKAAMSDEEKAKILIDTAFAMMNDGGRHWTKGTMRSVRHWFNIKTGRKEQEASYCMLGGLTAANQRLHMGRKAAATARRAIADAMKARPMRRENYTNDPQTIIMSNNDYHMTTWEDMKKWKAAAKRRLTKQIKDAA
jgi:hypothetical protein